jgi:hypothetical protein
MQMIQFVLILTMIQIVLRTMIHVLKRMMNRAFQLIKEYIFDVSLPPFVTSNSIITLKALGKDRPSVVSSGMNDLLQAWQSVPSILCVPILFLSISSKMEHRIFTSIWGKILALNSKSALGKGSSFSAAKT